MPECTRPYCHLKATKGFKTCLRCRTTASERRRRQRADPAYKERENTYRKRYTRWRAANPQKIAEYNRKAMRKSWVKIKADPVKLARFKKANRKSQDAWGLMNRSKLDRAKILIRLIAAGIVRKPKKCDTCHKAKKPINAYWQNGKIVLWACWTCWWARDRQEKGRL